MFKIVHINSIDEGGGAAIACRRHCEAMAMNGVDSTMVVVSKKSSYSYITQYQESNAAFLVNRFINRIVFKFCKALKPFGVFSIFLPGFNLFKCKEIKSADVIFIHWVNNGTLSLSGLEKILRLNKPTFWYLHDMFPITGGCHHSMGCNGFEESCENCPVIQNLRYKGVSHKQFIKKKQVFDKYPNLAFVAPSQWLTEFTKKSVICHSHDVFCVPNVINTEIFKPIGIQVKEKFGLNRNKRTILIGNASPQSPYKGLSYTIDCLRCLSPDKYELLVVGEKYDESFRGISLNIISTGYINGEYGMVEVYNACDTYLITSVAENYPNVILEAMACGKPCVGFPIGGIPDLIRHKSTGYVTSKCDSGLLVEGIEWLFSDENRYSTMARKAREQVLVENSYNQCKYIHKELDWDILCK